MKKIILLCSNGKLGEVQAACPGIPAAPIDMKDYGMMNGVAVLKAARKMMGEEV